MFLSTVEGVRPVLALSLFVEPHDMPGTVLACGLAGETDWLLYSLDILWRHTASHLI